MSEIDKILSKIVRICRWIESQEGLYALLHKGGSDYLGLKVDSQLSHLRQLIVSLIDAFPQSNFRVDLSGYQCPLDAYCEFMDVVRQIEEERSLDKDSLQIRFEWIDADTPREEIVVSDQLTKPEVEVTLASINHSVPPINSLALALDEVLR